MPVSLDKDGRVQIALQNLANNRKYRRDQRTGVLHDDGVALVVRLNDVADGYPLVEQPLSWCNTRHPRRAQLAS